MWEWIRDPNDCGRFWRCSWGRAIEMPRCPGGLILNTALHVCVRRRSVYDDCDAPVCPIMLFKQTVLANNSCVKRRFLTRNKNVKTRQGSIQLAV
nr:hypothetical protein BaRGS_014950 [Batillaria attramentaria]